MNLDTTLEAPHLPYLLLPSLEPITPLMAIRYARGGLFLISYITYLPQMLHCTFATHNLIMSYYCFHTKCFKFAYYIALSDCWVPFSIHLFVNKEKLLWKCDVCFHRHLRYVTKVTILYIQERGVSKCDARI
jgi:hypothetical protein